jgi:hypothetical protein
VAAKIVGGIALDADRECFSLPITMHSIDMCDGNTPVERSAGAGPRELGA